MPVEFDISNIISPNEINLDANQVINVDSNNLSAVNEFKKKYLELFDSLFEIVEGSNNLKLLINKTYYKSSDNSNEKNKLRFLQKGLPGVGNLASSNRITEFEDYSDEVYKLFSLIIANDQEDVN